MGRLMPGAIAAIQSRNKSALDPRAARCGERNLIGATTSFDGLSISVLLRKSSTGWRRCCPFQDRSCGVDRRLNSRGERLHEIRLAVFGLDLTDPPLAPA